MTFQRAKDPPVCHQIKTIATSLSSFRNLYSVIVFYVRICCAYLLCCLCFFIIAIGTLHVQCSTENQYLFTEWTPCLNYYNYNDAAVIQSYSQVTP